MLITHVSITLCYPEMNLFLWCSKDTSKTHLFFTSMQFHASAFSFSYECLQLLNFSEITRTYLTFSSNTENTLHRCSWKLSLQTLQQTLQPAFFNVSSSQILTPPSHYPWDTCNWPPDVLNTINHSIRPEQPPHWSSDGNHPGWPCWHLFLDLRSLSSSDSYHSWNLSNTSDSFSVNSSLVS